MWNWRQKPKQRFSRRNRPTNRKEKDTSLSTTIISAERKAGRGKKVARGTQSNIYNVLNNISEKGDRTKPEKIGIARRETKYTYK